MFNKIFASITLVLALSAHVKGHTLMTPALGVDGAGARSDVQVLGRKGASCGDMNVASNIDTSTPVAAAPDGTFTVTATNFNRRRDGSRELTATADSTGTGSSFNAPVTIAQNGDPKPKQLGSDQIVASLPAGMTCTGGASGNLCLVSFVNGAAQGFGNCVVVSQDTSGAGAAAAGTSAAGVDTTGTAGTGAIAGNAASGSVAPTANTAGAGAVVANAATGSSTNTAGSAVSQAGNAVPANAQIQPSQAGTRAARALLAALEVRGEDDLDVQIVKRALADWIWA
ncbi:hypothetical protein VKT23_017832 [Stygiomarasmius scandens]|uniref:Uncharacterized protein n=1 Tax=Marasmiellus scandens TaxID=2682957 RepID=A0ABR1IV21_9AGAR